jgi:predicted nucleic acid-binding protein
MSSNAFQLPEEFIPLLQKLNDGNSIEDNLKISAAISLFTKKVVSLGIIEELKCYLDFLMKSDYRISKPRYQKILQENNEL